MSTPLPPPRWKSWIIEKWNLFWDHVYESPREFMWAVFFLAMLVSVVIFFFVL